MDVLPPPERRGRVGIYRKAHLLRPQLISRLQDRGYSLAGIRDLVRSWRDGADLAEVLGLEPDQLVQLDEPGAPATLDQLTALLPTLVPTRLNDLVASGAVAVCGPDRYCVTSPSLLQLAVDALAAGYESDPSSHCSPRSETRPTSSPPPPSRSWPIGPRAPTRISSSHSRTRGRGLLAHGTGRLTIHAIGQRPGIDHDDTTGALRQLLGADP